MAESSRGRPLLRPLLWILAVLLAVIAAPFVWQHRPLGRLERRLVGTWISPRDPVRLVHFAADRQFTISRVSATAAGTSPSLEFLNAGVWSIRGDELRVSFSGPRSVPGINETILGLGYHEFGASDLTAPVRFREDDFVWLDDAPFTRQDEESSLPEID